MVASSSKEALIGGDTESVDLRVGVLDRSRADTRKGFPETEQTDVSKLISALREGSYRIVWS